eukprot:1194457-Rhodomonas_salina.2
MGHLDSPRVLAMANKGKSFRQLQHARRQEDARKALTLRRLSDTKDSAEAAGAVLSFVRASGRGCRLLSGRISPTEDDETAEFGGGLSPRSMEREHTSRAVAVLLDSWCAFFATN